MCTYTTKNKYTSLYDVCSNDRFEATNLCICICDCRKNSNCRNDGEVKKLGNKVMFPYLVDENTGKSFYESKYIATYLWENYSGGQKKPLLYRLATNPATSPVIPPPILIIQSCLEKFLLNKILSIELMVF